MTAFPQRHKQRLWTGVGNTMGSLGNGTGQLFRPDNDFQQFAVTSDPAYWHVIDCAGYDYLQIAGGFTIASINAGDRVTTACRVLATAFGMPYTDSLFDNPPIVPVVNGAVAGLVDARSQSHVLRVIGGDPENVADVRYAESMARSCPFLVNGSAPQVGDKSNFSFRIAKNFQGQGQNSAVDHEASFDQRPNITGLARIWLLILCVYNSSGSTSHSNIELDGHINAILDKRHYNASPKVAA